MDESTLRLLELAGSWLGGIGTIAAVVVALVLARRAEVVRLSVSVTTAVIIGRLPTGRPKYVWIKVTNLKERPATVQAVGWQVGKGRYGRWKRKLAYQFMDNLGPNSSPLPVTLTDGQAAQWLIPELAPGRAPWFEMFYKDVIAPWPPLISKLCAW